MSSGSRNVGVRIGNPFGAQTGAGAVVGGEEAEVIWQVQSQQQAPSPNIWALISRIGFWGHYTIKIIRNPQNSIGNIKTPSLKPFGGNSRAVGQRRRISQSNTV